jgi:hypothetical protein
VIGGIRLTGWVAALAATLTPACAAAAGSSTPNWATQHEAVVCGVAVGIEGTALDPGTESVLNGLWPGLQCQTTGIKPVSGVGDPAVQLGQGRAGRARLVDISQDDLQSDAPYAVLEPESIWIADEISCKVGAESVRCANAPGYGFTMSPGHLEIFAPVRAPAVKRCASVSYTFPNTGGHGHAALNNLTALGVSCATARSVARAFIVTGKAPRHWRVRMKGGKEILTRGGARVTGELAN